jgi:hypothetical protein
LEVVTSSLSSYTEKYEESLKEGGGSSWLGTITSMVGNIFLQEDTGLRLVTTRDSILYFRNLV